MSYEPQHHLSDPALPSAELRRTVGGFMLVVVLSTVFVIAWMLVIPGVLIPREVFATLPPTAPLNMLLTLSVFFCPAVALALVMRGLHRRRMLSLIGDFGLAWGQFRKVVLVQGMVLALAVALPSPGGLQPVQNLPWAQWLSWLPFALLALCVQVGIEELLFRGYLQSQLAARFASPVIWIGVPSILFALLHYAPGSGANIWPIIAITFLFAVTAADLTARCGTLGPALAMHLVNNIGSLLLIGTLGDMQGLALYVVPTGLSDPNLMPFLVLDAMLILIAWLGARIVLRR